MKIDIKYKKGHKGEKSFACVNKYWVDNNCLYMQKFSRTVVIPLDNIENFQVIGNW